MSLYGYLHQGGVFDYQREDGVYVADYRNVSNFNVGLLCQQSGLSLDETLRIAGGYASAFSNNAKPGMPYSLDPKTAEYTRIGYEVGASGVYNR